MGHDHPLEGQVEHLPQGRQRALLVPRRGPHEQLAVGRRQGIREHDGPLLGEPQRRLEAPAAVVEREQPAGQLLARVQRHEIGLRDAVAPEQHRAVRLRAVARHEGVDVAHVVGLDDRHHGRRPGVEALVRLVGPERVDRDDLPARLHAGARDRGIPVVLAVPLGVVDPPDPQPRGDVDDHRCGLQPECCCPLRQRLTHGALRRPVARAGRTAVKIRRLRSSPSHAGAR